MMKRLAPVMIGVSLVGLSACGHKNSGNTSGATDQAEVVNTTSSEEGMTLQNDAANAALAADNATANAASHERTEEGREEARKHGTRPDEATNTVASATPTPAPTTITYACSGNVTLVAAFAPNGAESVNVTLTDGSQVVLPREVTASGARYAKSGYELWQKGDGATWNDGKHAAAKCKPQ